VSDKFYRLETRKYNSDRKTFVWTFHMLKRGFKLVTLCNMWISLLNSFREKSKRRILPSTSQMIKQLNVHFICWSSDSNLLLLITLCEFRCWILSEKNKRQNLILLFIINPRKAKLK